MNKLLILLFISVGCTTTIKCDQGQVAMVALMDHGRHATLVIHVDGTNFRYGYGDWEYYALGNNSVAKGVKALLWPTKAGLGRKETPGPFNESFLMASVREGTEDILFLKGDVRQVLALKTRLDDIYFANIESKSYNLDYDLTFVPYPEDYWIFNNSNKVMSEWVDETGCESQGISLLSRWKLI